MSSLMHHLPVSEILNYTSLFNEFDQDIIENGLRGLNEENVIVVLSTEDKVKGMKEEKYLGGKYKIEELPKRKKSKIKFPPIQPNSLLPINV